MTADDLFADLDFEPRCNDRPAPGTAECGAAAVWLMQTHRAGECDGDRKSLQWSYMCAFHMAELRGLVQELIDLQQAAKDTVGMKCNSCGLVMPGATMIRQVQPVAMTGGGQDERHR